MPPSRRSSLAAALVTCLSSLTLACHRDEPATYLPKSGTWMYSQTFVDSDTCSENSLPDPASLFTLDYDDGDSFQIELGENDVTCEIDGTDFYCSEWVSESAIEGFAAILRYSVTWEGEFFSSTEAEGKEISKLVCIGEACPLVEMVVNVPCSRIVSFEAKAE